MSRAEAETPCVLWQDDSMLALRKPAGLHCFGPAPSLAAWLVEQEPGLAGVGPVDQPAIAHRLDRQTSGLVLAAKHDDCLEALRRAFSNKGPGESFEKIYLAVVCGHWPPGAEQRVDIGLGGRYRRSRRVWVNDGRRGLRGVQSAITELQGLASGQLEGRPVSLLRASMRSGMRHQIRAHLAYLGHPLVGDRLYEAPESLHSQAERFLLHAWIIVGAHPVLDCDMRWRCDPDDELMTVLREAGLGCADLLREA